MSENGCDSSSYDCQDSEAIESIFLFYMESVLFYINEYIDIVYFRWLLWVFYPLVITFVLPACLLLLVYASALFLHVYRLRHLWVSAVHQDFWYGGRRIICALWEAQSKIWHGHEIIGFEKIPEKGAALIIYYHAAIPVDLYYLLAKCVLHKNRSIHAVGDRFLFRIPGFKLLMDVMCVMPGTVSRGVELMKDGQILAIAPGGVREALFSDEYYEVLWGQRTGFAKIALEAQVPVIPVFTQNSREAFRSLGLGRALFRWVYEKTRLPVVPLYGGFPVKLRTLVGDPIMPDVTMTPDELTVKVKRAIEQLISNNQRLPGSIVMSLIDRFRRMPEAKTTRT